MDAATIAARQREGGGAPNQRRPAREGSAWKRLGQTLRRFLIRPLTGRTASPRSVQLFKSEQRSLSVRSSITVPAGASTPGVLALSQKRRQE
jgi:hypothetical protein